MYPVFFGLEGGGSDGFSCGDGSLATAAGTPVSCMGVFSPASAITDVSSSKNVLVASYDITERKLC